MPRHLQLPRVGILPAALLLATAAGCTHASRTASTGKRLARPPAALQNVGSWPMNMLLSPGGHYAFTSDMGKHEALWCISTRDGHGVSSIRFSNRHHRRKLRWRSGMYYGLAESTGHVLYAAGGANDRIAVIRVGHRGRLHAEGAIHCRTGDFPAGLALDSRNRLYVANNAAGGGHGPFNHPGSLAIYDRTTRRELGRYVFKNHFGNTSNYPYAVAVMADGSKAYVTSERAGAVYVLNTRNPKNIRLIARLPTGRDPDALLLTAEQQTLYVANAGSDTVSVIDTGTDQVTGTINLRPPQARGLLGATPTALALSPTQRRLYVACADLNAVAVVSVNTARVRGYVPAGWYPTGVAISAKGDKILICNAKGTDPRHPNIGYDPLGSYGPKNYHSYILNLIRGNVECMPLPHGAALTFDTRRVLAENRFNQILPPGDNPLKHYSRKNGLITHVFYIVKENRTYDQVLGDIKRGNGDPALTIFGDRITPNEHALARRFVLFDNLDTSGEVSGDGWVWSTQGLANAYTERNVPYNYSGRGRTFDFQGQNNSYITGGFPGVHGPYRPGTTPSFINGGPRIRNVASTGLYIWDLARRAGLSIRNYGVYLSYSHKAFGLLGVLGNYPTVPGLQPGGHNLAGISDLDFRRFDLNYSDSDAPAIYYRRTHNPHCLYPERTYGKYHATSRFAEWDREFKLMLKRDPSGRSVPAFEIITFMLDHTAGLYPGAHSPESNVANNDYAVGEFVQAISHSPIWRHSAIFIIEDDSQNGPDHVDAHRTTGYLISPFVKRHNVDHRFYNTDSMLHTMELLLNLPPMTQYDALARPMLDFTRSPRNIRPYHAILPSRRIIAQINPPVSAYRPGSTMRALAAASAKMDFTHPDRAPELALNRIIWKSVRGPHSHMP